MHALCINAHGSYTSVQRQLDKKSDVFLLEINTIGESLILNAARFHVIEFPFVIRSGGYNHITSLSASFISNVNFINVGINILPMFELKPVFIKCTVIDIIARQSNQKYAIKAVGDDSLYRKSYKFIYICW